MPSIDRTLPEAADMVLQRLGGRIRQARLNQRLAPSEMARRAMISLDALERVERGDPDTAIGCYAAALTMLGAIADLDLVAIPPARLANEVLDDGF